MPENFEHSFQPEVPQSSKDDKGDKLTRREVLREMKEIAYAEAPKAEENWDLVWVLSGPIVDIKKESTKENRNESRERLETGLKVAREVTAVRLRKEIKDVTMADILEKGPIVFWNATDEANDNLKERAEEGLLEERYGFPREKLIVSPNLGIKHTGHQFERFPKELEEKSRKVVLVSDTYHLPRITRYFEADYNIIPPEKIILYPSEPRKVPVGKALGETKKVPKYIKEGILPKEEKEKK